MAKEVVTRCDVCGTADETVRTYTIRTDGKTWEVDLDEKHALPILKVAQKGREVANLSRVRDPNRSLEQRIRNAPDRQE